MTVTLVGWVRGVHKSNWSIIFPPSILERDFNHTSKSKATGVPWIFDHHRSDFFILRSLLPSRLFPFCNEGAYIPRGIHLLHETPNRVFLTVLFDECNPTATIFGSVILGSPFLHEIWVALISPALRLDESRNISHVRVSKNKKGHIRIPNSIQQYETTNYLVYCFENKFSPKFRYFIPTPTK